MIRNTFVLDELIRRANSGDADAGRALLSEFVDAADRSKLQPRLIGYIAEGFSQYVRDKVPLERALGVENEEPDKGGRPKVHNPDRIMLLYLLCHEHLEIPKERAMNKVMEITGASRDTIQRARHSHTKYEKYDFEVLLAALDIEDLIPLSTENLDLESD